MEGQEFCDFIRKLRSNIKTTHCLTKSVAFLLIFLNIIPFLFLAEKGMFHVLTKVFDYLDLSSLENAAQVSKGWAQAISHETRNKLRSFLVGSLLWFTHLLLLLSKRKSTILLHYFI